MSPAATSPTAGREAGDVEWVDGVAAAAGRVVRARSTGRSAGAATGAPGTASDAVGPVVLADAGWTGAAPDVRVTVARPAPTDRHP